MSRGDVANLADLDRLYQTVQSMERIDIAFTDAKGAPSTVQKTLPLPDDDGAIILTGSAASVKGATAFAVYGASKAVIRNFVRGWTIELKGRRIRSNVLSPNGPMPSRRSCPPFR